MPTRKFLLAVTLTLVSSLGCASGEGESAEASDESDDPLITSCLKEIEFGNVRFQTPTTWGMSRLSATEAVIGRLAGGPEDAELRVKSGYTGTVDALRPRSCFIDGRGTSPPTSVRLLDSGFLPVGERTAEYRAWMLTCADGTARFPSAWLLPVSQIGIVQQVHHTSLINERVVTNAAAGGDAPGGTAICIEPTKDLTFGHLTFRMPSTWNMQTNGDLAFVGVLAGGAQDANLRVRQGYKGTVGELEPTSCPREGGPALAVRSVVESERGVLPVGKYGASYRRWTVTCSDGAVEKHRAWVLRGHEMAIYEQREAKRNLSVVSYAVVN